MVKFKPYKNKIWLEKKCESYTTREIANQCGCSPPTIVVWVKRFGITRKEDRQKSDSLKTRFSLNISNYMMLHMRQYAEKSGESVNQIVVQAITEFFLRSNINIFREQKDE